MYGVSFFLQLRLVFMALISHVYLLQMMMQLVKSSWVLHLSCNKRRVAPIAALLSAILHPSIFPNLEMHQTNEKGPGPLKWVSSDILCITSLSFYLTHPSCSFPPLLKTVEEALTVYSCSLIEGLAEINAYLLLLLCVFVACSAKVALFCYMRDLCMILRYMLLVTFHWQAFSSHDSCYIFYE